MRTAVPRAAVLQEHDATSVPWLWRPRLAAGRLTLLEGDPGQGKSLLTLDIAARVSTGRDFPDGPGLSEPATVLLAAGDEDNVADTIVPRLIAAGADLGRVQLWTGAANELPILPRDLDDLGEAIERTAARLVIFDPFFAFLGRDTGSLNELSIRRVLAPLARLAAVTQAVILLIRHLGKGTVGRAACYRGLGSSAILAAMRTAFLLASDPQDAGVHVLACTKTFAACPPSLAFRIATTDAGQPILDWHGPVARTADELVEARRPYGEAIAQAVRFLQERLTSGWAPRATVLAQAAAEGISFRTLERAKAGLRVQSQERRENGRNVWYWRLAVPAQRR
jgi:hypothetical protein